MKEEIKEFMEDDLSFEIGDNLATDLLNAKQKQVRQKEVVTVEDCEDVRDIIIQELEG